MRALFAYREDVDAHGGAASVMESTAAHLHALGAEVEITYDARPDTAGFDVVHAWNIWKPSTALDQLRHLRASGVPVIWQPFYLHWTEAAWAQTAVYAVFSPQRAESERRQLIRAMAGGTLTVGSWQRHLPNEIEPGFHETLRQMLLCVDHVCACSSREMQMLTQITGSTHKPWTLTRHGVDAAAFRDASPEPFAERYGVRDFVLCVGAVDARKNQLMLVEALRGSGRPLVLLGPSYEAEYLQLCRSRMDENVIWIDRVPRDMVASAYHAAAVHVMPSFAEGSALASMEAAAAGCPVVVSNRSSEFEYYGDLATYCDPVDPESIAEAVEHAFVRGADPAHRRALATHMEQYTWQDAARATLAACERAVAERAGARRAALGLQGTRTRAVLAFADEIVERPTLLQDYARAVSAADDMTLVIGLPTGPQGLEDRLVDAASAAGIDGPDGADVIAFPLPDPVPAALSDAVDAVLSERDVPAELSALPRVRDDRDLRALAAGAA